MSWRDWRSGRGRAATVLVGLSWIVPWLMGGPALAAACLGLVGASVLAVFALLAPLEAAPVLFIVLLSRASDRLAPAEWVISPTQATVALFLAGVLLARVRSPRRTLVVDRVVLSMLIYAATIALSAVAATNRLATLAALIAFLRELVIVFLILNLVTSFSRLRVALWSLVAVGVCLTSAAIIHVGTGHDFGGMSTIVWLPGPAVYLTGIGPGIRIEGPFGLDSNHYAQLLVMLAGIALHLAWAERTGLFRVVAFASTVLMSAAAIWTNSRGGFVAMVVVLLVVTVRNISNRRRLLTIGLLVSLAVAASPLHYWERIGLTAGRIAGLTPSIGLRIPVPITAPPTSAMPDSQRAWSAYQSSSSALASLPRFGDSMYDRLVLMKLGLLILSDHPLTGVGRGNYYAVYPQYVERVGAFARPQPLGSHNLPVFIAAESGALGLLGFSLVIGSAVVTLRRAHRRSAGESHTPDRLYVQAIESGLLAFLTASMFLNDNAHTRSLWVMVGLAAAAGYIALRQSARSGARESAAA